MGDALKRLASLSAAINACGTTNGGTALCCASSRQFDAFHPPKFLLAHRSRCSLEGNHAGCRNNRTTSESMSLVSKWRSQSWARSVALARYRTGKGSRASQILFLNGLLPSIVGEDLLLRETRPWSGNGGRGEFSQHSRDDRRKGGAESRATREVHFSEDRRKG